MTSRHDRQRFGARSVVSATKLSTDRLSRGGRRRDEGGQALVELVLVLPLVALLLGVAFNGWNGMQLAERLTSAARAGAIQAANELGNANPPATQTNQTVLDDATKAVNAEEGDGGSAVYQDSNSGADDYVSMTTSQQTISTPNGGTLNINVVTITITQRSSSLVPFVGTFPVTAHATARYS